MPWQAALLRYGPLVIAAVCILFAVYTKGRSDCAVRHAREDAKAADEWAERVTKAASEAYRRGQEAAEKEAKKSEKADAIVKDIPPAGVCVTADAVERLRELQVD